MPLPQQERGTRRVIEIVEESDAKSQQDIMAEDLLAIVAIFAGRLYGNRSLEFRQKVKVVMDEMGKSQPNQEGF
jgi:predicted site-specific integrase-resolvase